MTPDEPPAVPGLVLRLQVTVPEHHGALSALRAQPDLWTAAGADTGGPRQESSRAAGLGPLAFLVISAEVGYDGTPARWRAEYRELRAIDEHRAEEMHRTLASLRSRLQQDAGLYGPPAGFEQRLALTAAALGAAGSSPFAVREPAAGRPRGGWRRCRAAELPGWLSAQLARCRAVAAERDYLAAGLENDLQAD